MNFSGNLMTTGMGILPHVDIDKALDLAFRVDIPFWPQLPHIHYHENMYAQFSEHFPGMLMPATCSLITPDGDATVERAYDTLIEVADQLKTRYSSLMK